MKKHLLMKTLLVALVCLVGGTSSVWGASNFLPTLTGQVGTATNLGNFEYATKKVKIAAGETYVYTLTNFNDGNNDHYWQNWVVEGNLGEKYFDCEARGNQWQAGSGPVPSYTPVMAYTDVENFQTAYNGANVTITISRNAAGDQFTVTHTSNVLGTTAGNTEKYYGGTWTVAVGAEEEWDIYITEEYAHFVVNKVVYTDDSGVVTNYERKNVDLSEFDANSSYSEGTASFTLGSSKWSKLDLSSYYSGITGTITNINLSFTENIGTGGRMCFGIFGSNKSAWGNGMPETANSVSTWGVCGSSNANRVYYGNNSNVNTLTPGSEKAIEVFMDMVNKRFTFVQAGTTLVNNQSFMDTGITSPRYFAGHTWTNESNATTLKNMSMEIVYVEASYYTATFTNTTSSNTPTVTIYTDSGRTSEISNGLLEDGETYYFTAVEEGYQNYNGSFTVSGADPVVDFAMTAKLVYNFTVNAVDGEDHIIKANIASGSCYANEEKSFYIPACVYVGGKLYFTTNENYKKTETISSNDQVITYQYTTNTVDNVVFFVEGEGVSGAAESTPSANQHLASMGHMGRGSNLVVTNLPTGAYTIYVKYCNYNGSAQNLLVKAGDTNLINEGVSARATKSADFSLLTSTDITLTATASSISGVDYIYIVRTGDATVPATLNSAGLASFSSAYPLDLSGISGATAYYAKSDGLSAGKVTLTEATGSVAAGEGLILKGENGAAVTIPVAATGTAISGNLMVGCPTAQDITSTTEGYANIYVLGASDAQLHNVKDYVVANTTLSIPAGKAYLKASIPSGARSLTISFEDDDVTGVNEVRSQKEDVRSEWFDLQGRKVAQPQKGLYIVNGKKVVLK